MYVSVSDGCRATRSMKSSYTPRSTSASCTSNVWIVAPVAMMPELTRGIIPATTTDVTSLPGIAPLVFTGRMTGYEEKDPAWSGQGDSQADPQPANEALPDGQFQDQEM